MPGGGGLGDGDVGDDRADVGGRDAGDAGDGQDEVGSGGDGGSGRHPDGVPGVQQPHRGERGVVGTDDDVLVAGGAAPEAVAVDRVVACAVEGVGERAVRVDGEAGGGVVGDVRIHPVDGAV